MTRRDPSAEGNIADKLIKLKPPGNLREILSVSGFERSFGLPMRGDVIIVGLLVVLIALILRMRTKYNSERIQTIGFVILGIIIVVVGLIVN